MSTPSTTRSGGELEMSGFLIAHAGMRQEFGLLAKAAAGPLEPARAALVEDQIAMVLEVLHHHHTAEDDTIWPTLLARVPAAAADLDALEAEHARIDPLISAAGDRGRPLAERAPVLAELHELINATWTARRRPRSRSSAPTSRWPSGTRSPSGRSPRAAGAPSRRSTAGTPAPPPPSCAPRR